MAAAVDVSARTDHGQAPRNVLTLAGGQAATWLLATVWIVFVPRAIGPVGMGDLTTAYSVTGVVTGIVGFGVTTFLVKEIARSRQRGLVLIPAALGLQLAVAVPAVLMVATYSRLGRFDGTLLAVLWIFSATALLEMTGARLEAAFQGIQRMEYVAAGRVLTRAGVTGLAIAIVSVGLGVVQLAWMSLLVTAAVTCVQVRWLLREFNLEWRVDLREVRRLAVAALPYGAGDIVAVTYLWVDSMLLALLTPTRVVGWYGAPTRLLGALLFVPVILSAAWLPRMADKFTTDRALYRVGARATLELTLVAAIPIATGTLIIAPDVVRLLYGDQFAPAAPVLAILALSIPFMYLNVAAWSVLVAADRQLTWIKLMAVATVVNVALNVLLIEVLQRRTGNGGIGSALALLTTEVLMAAGAVVLMRGLLTRGTASRVLRALAVSVLMAALVLAVRPLGLAAELLCGAGLFLAGALLLRVFTPAELRQAAGAALKARGAAA
ncbi:MAG TPA: flippase [Candidatus Dormibacteraeota bacterium]